MTLYEAPRGYRIVAIAADCKSALIEFGGSSPSTLTIGDEANLVEATD